jgi:hypothetical protein
MPLYGRSFANTDGIGRPYQGVGEGTWEAGSIDYKALPRPGASVNVDQRLVASWSYDQRTRELITYDTPEVGETKAGWIAQHGFGGGALACVDSMLPAEGLGSHVLEPGCRLPASASASVRASRRPSTRAA